MYVCYRHTCIYMMPNNVIVFVIKKTNLCFAIVILTLIFTAKNRLITVFCH